MVSLIQSNYTGFGSGYVVPELGLRPPEPRRPVLARPGHPNALEPGKRPFHTIIPAFVTKDGEPLMAFGVMGGDMQPQGHVQVLVNLIDFGMNLQEAGDATRFHHTGSTEPTGTVMTRRRRAPHRGRLCRPRCSTSCKRRGHVIEPEAVGAVRRLPGDLARPGNRRVLRRDREAQGRLRARLVSLGQLDPATISTCPSRRNSIIRPKTCFPCQTEGVTNWWMGNSWSAT